MAQKLLIYKKKYNYRVSGNAWQDEVFKWGSNDFVFISSFIGQNEENIGTSDLSDFTIPKPQNLLMTSILSIITHSNRRAIVSSLIK